MQNSNTKTYVTKSCAVVDNGRDAVLNATRMIYKTVYKDGTDQSMGIGAISISRTDILSTPELSPTFTSKASRFGGCPTYWKPVLDRV